MPPGFEKSKLNVYQANLRWVLKHDVACVVHSAIGTDAAMQDQAIAASQTTIGEADHVLLDRYARALSPEYCRGCKACEGACPEHVSIAHVLHLRMYDRRLGMTTSQAAGGFDVLMVVSLGSAIFHSCNQLGSKDSAILDSISSGPRLVQARPGLPDAWIALS